MISEFQALGFTRNEALVYQAALRAGEASVQELASASGLNRITVHSIVDKFEGLQILSHRYIGRRRRVIPVDPHRLVQILRTEEQRLHQKQSALKGVLPSLLNQFRQSQRGMHVRTFKGESGFEEMCEDVLREKTDMMEYANIDALNAAIGPYIASDYLPRKHAAKIRTKFLFVDTPGARTYIKKHYMQPSAAPMEVKFMKKEEFSMDTMFVLYANKLALLDPSNLDGVIIEDALIADAMRPFFQAVWRQAGEGVTNELLRSSCL